jgi:hypothetical protein
MWGWISCPHILPESYRVRPWRGTAGQPCLSALAPQESFKALTHNVINEVMERIQDESITGFVYDAAAGKLRAEPIR